MRACIPVASKQEASRAFVELNIWNHLNKNRKIVARNLFKFYFLFTQRKTYSHNSFFAAAAAAPIRYASRRLAASPRHSPVLTRGRCVATRNKIQMSFPKSRKMSHIHARVCCMHSCTRKIIWCSLICHDDMIRQLNSASVVGHWAVHPAARTPLKTCSRCRAGGNLPHCCSLLGDSIHKARERKNLAQWFDIVLGVCSNWRRYLQLCI